MWRPNHMHELGLAAFMHKVSTRAKSVSTDTTSPVERCPTLAFLVFTPVAYELVPMLALLVWGNEAFLPLKWTPRSEHFLRPRFE